MRLMTVFPAVGAAAALAAGGLAVATSGSGAAASASSPPSGLAAAQIRADAFATVASRLYREEVTGPVGRSNATRIAHDRQFIAALASGNRAAIRAAALHELFLPGYHVVRIRVVRNGHTIVDVGGRFVAGQESTTLRAPDGADLGRLEISMQDILGLTKLENRFTGAGMVVHGRAGHVIATSPALTKLRMPSSGPVVIAGRRYVVRSLERTGFAGEPLRMTVVVPA